MTPVKIRGTPARRGFTLIELVIVLAIIAILALMAMPLLYGNTARAQILESMPLANSAKAAVNDYYKLKEALPADNDTAGLPEGNKMVGNYVTSIEVSNGAVNITYGNNAHAKIKGKRLTWRPAISKLGKAWPISWVCANKAAPAETDVGGTNITDVPPDALPIGPPPYECR